MAIKILKLVFNVSLVSVVIWNTWNILRLNAAMTAVVTFLLQGMGR